MPGPQQFQGPFHICIGVGFTISCSLLLIPRLLRGTGPHAGVTATVCSTTCVSYTFSRLRSESWCLWVTFLSLYSKYLCVFARACTFDSHPLNKLYVLYASIYFCILCIYIFMYSYCYVCSVLGILFHCVVLCTVCV